MAQRFCMKCGKPLNATDKFCIYCGTLAGAVAPGKNPSVQAGGPQPVRPPMQQMGGGMRPPVQQPGSVPGSRRPQYVQPTGQFPVQAPMQPAGQFPVQPPVQPARPPMQQNARPPMQQPVQPVGQIPQQMRPRLAACARLLAPLPPRSRPPGVVPRPPRVLRSGVLEWVSLPFFPVTRSLQSSRRRRPFPAWATTSRPRCLAPRSPLPWSVSVRAKHTDSIFPV